MLQRRLDVAIIRFSWPAKPADGRGNNYNLNNTDHPLQSHEIVRGYTKSTADGKELVAQPIDGASRAKREAQQGRDPFFHDACVLMNTH